MLIRVKNESGDPKRVLVALYPLSSEADGEIEQTVHDLAGGTETEITVPEGRYVRLVETDPGA